MKKTALANEYAKGDFTPIDEETYIDLLTYSLKKLPENIIVQRISAGIDDPNLLAPSWSRDKNKQFANIRRRLKKENIVY